MTGEISGMTHNKRIGRKGARALAILGLMVVASFAGGPGARAQGLLALSGIGNGPEVTRSAHTGYTLGWEFTATRNLDVTALGLLDFGSSGSRTHQVGIWDPASGRLLASAVVVNPGNDDGNYISTRLLSPVQLNAGYAYVIGAEYDGPVTDGFIAQSSGAAFSPAVQYTGPANGADVGFSMPTASSDQQQAYYGPQFTFTLVPEPSSLALAALGAVVLAIRRRPRA